MKAIIVLSLFSLLALVSARSLFPSYEERLNRILSKSDAKDGPEEQWFIQKLDHFNRQDAREWKQRYFVNDTFWDTTNVYGGPIFVQLGGEGAISPGYVTRLQMVEYASQYGALAVALEHRFYGKSNPLGDLSTDHLQYLSSQQAMADAAYFITELKKQYNVPYSPVVTFGCSYPGALSAWFRENYPSVTMASVASSSPVQATLDFYGYLDVVNSSLAHFAGEVCDARIQSATDTIQSLLQTSAGKSQIQTLFKTCAPIGSNGDIAVLMSTLMGYFQGIVQYNDENGNPIDISYVCNIMENSTVDPLTAYVQINNLFLQQAGTPCLDISYQDMIDQVKNVSQPEDGVGIRSWTYQTCAEFGYFQTTDSPNQPFGDLVPVTFYTQMCSDIFGMDPNGIAANINQTNALYGGNDLSPWGPTNILFVNGNIDPWHALSVTTNLSPSLQAILIDGTAHCANVEPSSPNDPPSLVAARQKTSLQIEQWLLETASY